MKIFTSAQIHELDKYTIEHEPIASLELMERAAKALTQAITGVWNNTTPVIVFAGPGNNGGDALAVARLLADQGYQVSVYLFNISGHLSADCAANKKRLEDSKQVKVFIEVTQEFDPPVLEKGMLVIDGLFGSGLNKPLAGGFASLVKYINASPAEVVSIDVPSGLMTEDNTYNVRANIIRPPSRSPCNSPSCRSSSPRTSRSSVSCVCSTSDSARRVSRRWTRITPSSRKRASASCCWDATLCPQRTDGQRPAHCRQLLHGRCCGPGQQGMPARRCREGDRQLAPPKHSHPADGRTRGHRTDRQ